MRHQRRNPGQRWPLRDEVLKKPSTFIMRVLIPRFSGMKRRVFLLPLGAGCHPVLSQVLPRFQAVPFHTRVEWWKWGEWIFQSECRHSNYRAVELQSGSKVSSLVARSSHGRCTQDLRRIRGCDAHPAWIWRIHRLMNWIVCHANVTCTRQICIRCASCTCSPRVMQI
jgi:hypothetical protein